MNAHVLMLSSSRQGQDGYLEHARPLIIDHAAESREILFIPFAAVTRTYDDYVSAVAEALPEFAVKGLHEHEDPIKAIHDAKLHHQTILVGGGNTFHLLHTLYKQGLIAPLKHAIADGTTYIGWSAGSNICGNSIRTTNDMPIIEPPSFDALQLLPFQLNPHYTDYHPPNHNGETRDERLAEFTALNPDMPVVAIREGTALRLSQGKLSLLGDLGGFIFKGNQKNPISAGDDLSYLLDQPA